MAEPTTLGELADRGVLYINDGYRTKASELGNEGLPVLRVAEVRDGSVQPSFKDHVRQEFRSRMGGKTSRPDDVLITTKGTVGRAALMPASLPEFVYSPQLCVLRVLDGRTISPRWLYAWARSPDFQRQANVVARQTDMAPYINLVDLRRMVVNLPSFPEQHAVAEVLGALDDKIEANTRLAAVCEDLAIAQMATVPSRRSLADLVSASRDQMKPEEFAGEVVEHFSLPAFDERRMPELCAGTAIKSNKFRIRGPCVLVSKLNPHIPRVWYAEPSPARAALASTEFVVLNPRGACSPTVLWAACAGPEFASAIAERVTGTTGSHQRVNTQDLLDTLVPDVTALSGPARELVDGLVLRALAARRESQVLAQLRDVLLLPLISGELRVTMPESP